MLVAPKSEVDRRIENFRSLASMWRGQFIDGITASIGVASIKDYPSSSLEELCKHADDNMFLDKKKFYAESGYERRN
jgi:GGDEF domain-containing protein